MSTSILVFLVCINYMNRTVLNQFLSIVTRADQKPNAHHQRRRNQKKAFQNQFCCYFNRSPKYRSLAISFFLYIFSVYFFSIFESCFSFSRSIPMAFVTCVFTFFLMLIHFYLFVLFRSVWFGRSCLTRTTVEVPASLFARTVQLLSASGMRACCASEWFCLFSGH